MECPEALFVIGTLLSLEYFGESFSIYKGPVLISAHHTIPKPTGRPKLLIAHLRCIFVASQVTGQGNGFVGFLGWNIATIPAITQQPRKLLMSLCMAAFRPPF